MKEEKITIIIGAGASTPFYNNELTTSYLTKDALFNKSIWQKLLKMFNNYKKDGSRNLQKLRIDINDVFFILGKIYHILKKSQRFKNVNFEYIIHLLDKISNYLYSEINVEYANIDEYLIDFWHICDSQLIQYAFKNSDKAGWKYVPFLGREVIATAILELWESNTSKDSININKDFFSSLLKQFKSVNIYSLNYDPLLYESLKDIKDFVHGFVGNIFDSSVFYKADNVIAFVHGHVGFEPYQNQMKFNSNYNNAQENRIKGLFDAIITNRTKYWTFGMKGIHYNTYLVTGLDKIDAFSLNPFASYIHRFGKDIIESSYIILIGLSLIDYHLNAFLTNSLFISDKRIIFVTKSDVDTIIDKLSEGRYSLIHKLWTLFKDAVSLNINYEEDPFKKHRENLRKSLSQNGFGKLTDHIVLYIKGVENFYKEKNLIWDS